MKDTALQTPLKVQTQEYVLIDRCQACGEKTDEVMSLGLLPPVDLLPDMGQLPDSQEKKYPAPLLFCPGCQLLQLGCVIDQKVLFPEDYPYTSGTTKILRDNFAQLANECLRSLKLNSDDLVIDIGCNDGTLLKNFKGHCRVLGITPENMGQLARRQGIPVVQSYFTREAAQAVLASHGQAKLITATNVFAHMINIDEIISSILELLTPQGVFVSESGYLFSLLERLQYDTIHHEHLRYYSLTSLNHLFRKYDLEIIHAAQIPTHGGSIRVYAARRGEHPIADSVPNLLELEKNKLLSRPTLKEFKDRVLQNRALLSSLLRGLKDQGARIYGVGAPGRATVLINYCGIDERTMECTVEVRGSHKIGKCVPGTTITITDEEKLFSDQPDYALILSWHIAQELMPKLKKSGFQGDFIVPLPNPAIIRNNDV